MTICAVLDSTKHLFGHIYITFNYNILSEIEKSLYLFEADMFFIKRYNDYKNMNSFYLKEADENNNSENHADTIFLHP